MSSTLPEPARLSLLKTSRTPTPTAHCWTSGWCATCWGLMRTRTLACVGWRRSGARSRRCTVGRGGRGGPSSCCDAPCPVGGALRQAQGERGRATTRVAPTGGTGGPSTGSGRTGAGNHEGCPYGGNGGPFDRLRANGGGQPRGLPLRGERAPFDRLRANGGGQPRGLPLRGERGPFDRLRANGGGQPRGLPLRGERGALRQAQGERGRATTRVAPTGGTGGARIRSS